MLYVPNPYLNCVPTNIGFISTSLVLRNALISCSPSEAYVKRSNLATIFFLSCYQVYNIRVIIFSKFVKGKRT